MTDTIRRLRLVLVWVALTAIVCVLGVVASAMPAAAAACSSGATMNFVAHEDDDLLFQNPMVLQRVQAGGCLRTVYVLAGDAGEEETYWGAREDGVEAAYAYMMGVADAWTTSDAGVPGHPIRLRTLTAAPNVSLAFMRLPDGAMDGGGFERYDDESLQKLYAQTIPAIYAVDGSTQYSLDELVATFTALMTAYQPNSVNTLDLSLIHI